VSEVLDPLFAALMRGPVTLTVDGIHAARVEQSRGKNSPYQGLRFKMPLEVDWANRHLTLIFEPHRIRVLVSDENAVPGTPERHPFSGEIRHEDVHALLAQDFPSLLRRLQDICSRNFGVLDTDGEDGLVLIGGPFGLYDPATLIAKTTVSKTAARKGVRTEMQPLTLVRLSELGGSQTAGGLLLMERSTDGVAVAPCFVVPRREGGAFAFRVEAIGDLIELLLPKFGPLLRKILAIPIDEDLPSAQSLSEELVSAILLWPESLRENGILGSVARRVR
jgi:hypothetical protein